MSQATKKANDHSSLELAGRQVNYLTVIERTNQRAGSSVLWRCKCVCGRDDYLAPAHDLNKGEAKSCGCMKKEILRLARTTHGMKKSRAYSVWRNMRARCEKPQHKSFSGYGARGISVCGRWQDFVNFYADMGDPPAGLQIERINNDGNYEPGNCTWATVKAQANNRRNNVLITRDGITKTMSQWAEESGLGVDTAFRRLRAGWSQSDAFSTPPRHKTKTLTYSAGVQL